MAKAVERVDQVTIRFAGDSGDGMQLTGARFTSETAVLGNDLSTLPDFPAELREKFANKPEIAEANVRALQAGYAFGETTEGFAVQYEVAPAPMTPGVYRNVTGNQALAFGLVAASVKSKLPIFLGAYPITPASGILEELAGYKQFGVRTFQAEDEIAAVGAALGASFGGSLAVSTSSGPGIVLKQEAIGLGITPELPLIIVDVQRAGPSPGMPTKPEQADLPGGPVGRNPE